MSILETFLKILHVFVCAVLIFVVLLQQGKGGGMGAAFGGGGAAQVFGGRGAGNILTWATATCAAIFMLTSVSLAYISSSGDRAIKVRAAMEEKKRLDKGSASPGAKSGDKPAEKPAGDKPTDMSPAPMTPAPTK